MKLFLFLIGAALSVWVGFTVYTPSQTIVVEVQKIYIESKTLQKTITQKGESAINSLTSTYQEVARIFGVQVAEDTLKKDILEKKNGEPEPVAAFFQHDIALYIAIFSGFLTFSVYCNIISFIAFFLKPITFFMRK